MRRWILLGLLCFLGCTHSESPELKRMRAKLASSEKELGVLEERMKDPTIEIGLKDQLSTERELMRSRLERIRENLRALEKNSPE